MHAADEDWEAVLAVSAELVRLDPAAADPDGLATRARELTAPEPEPEPDPDDRPGARPGARPDEPDLDEDLEDEDDVHNGRHPAHRFPVKLVAGIGAPSGGARRARLLAAGRRATTHRRREAKLREPPRPR